MSDYEEARADVDGLERSGAMSHVDAAAWRAVIDRLERDAEPSPYDNTGAVMVSGATVAYNDAGRAEPVYTAGQWPTVE